MKSSALTLLSLSSFLFYSCSQNLDSKTPQQINDSITSGSIPELPGIDRSVFSEIQSQAIPIECDTTANKTGAFYREQSKVSIPANFISGSMHVGQPNISPDKDVSTIYTGGDTSVGGAMDFGVVADVEIPGYWKPFMKLQVNSTTTKEIASVNDDIFQRNDGAYKVYQRHRISPNADASFSLKVGSNGVITGTITARMTIFEVRKLNGIMQPNPKIINVLDNINVIFTATGGGWSAQGKNQVFKLMESIALKNMNGDISRNYQLESVGNTWSNVKIGMLGGTSIDWNTAKDSTRDCASPNDIVEVTTKPNANIYMRVKSTLVTAPNDPIILNAIVGKTANLDLSIMNSGPEKSKLYYNIPNHSFIGVLLGGKSITRKFTYRCERKEILTKYIDLYYSENESFTYGTAALSNFPTSDYSSQKPAPNTLYGLKFKLKSIKVMIGCFNAQKFNTPNTTITSIVKEPGSKLVNLTVTNPDTSAPITGQFAFTVPPVAAAGISAQSIYVDPSGINTAYSPASGPNQATIPVTISAKCPAKPETYNTKGWVQDPTGNTEPAEVPITLTCLGPVLSDPTPNPVSISANVGETATGSFSFSNNAQADDQGRKAPLHFTVSGSGSLSVSPSGGTLSGGNSQSVTVNYPCTTAGTFNETATVTSSDEGGGSKAVGVSVECNDIPQSHFAMIGTVEGQVWSASQRDLPLFVPNEHGTCKLMSRGSFYASTGTSYHTYSGSDETHTTQSGLPVKWNGGYWWIDCSEVMANAKGVGIASAISLIGDLEAWWLANNDPSINDALVKFEIKKGAEIDPILPIAEGSSASGYYSFSVTASY